ncbi:MAG: GH25 family lysozyme [Nannocystaceae bacterium]
MVSSRSLPTPRLSALALVLASVAASATLAAAPATAAPLADRPFGHALGDGLAAGELGLGLSADLGAQQAQVCADGETLFGIDVSYYQGDIDWQQVAGDGVKYAWIRVSHSTQFLDPKFQQNLAGARAAGIHAGVYQYFEPTEDPIAQAELLLSELGPLEPGDLPPMIDVESAKKVDKAAYADAIRAWLDHVEAATGARPFIYTGYYYWKDYVGTDEFVDHPLWIANYNPGCPLIPDYWPTWKAHQFCDCGTIAGIQGPVDSNNWNGDMADLLDHTVGGAVCGDGKCVFGEDPVSCPADCPPCGVIPPHGATIEDGDACAELYGDPQYWRLENVGHAGSLRWTNATDFDAPSNYAIWRLFFAEAGLYSLAAWVEPPFGESQAVRYIVRHAGGETVVPVDQAAASGWVDLGAFDFDAAADHWVRIDDNTGEANDLEISIAFDALEVTRVDDAPDTTTSTSGDGTGTSGGDTGTGGDLTTGADTGSGGSTTGVAGTTGGDLTTTTDSAGLGGDEDEGCGCRSADLSGGGTLSLWALALLGARRRRRRRGARR